MIYSFRPGRVRLRARALCEPCIADEIQAMLHPYPGVRSVQVNTRTGSLLVHYDQECISQQQLQMALALMEQRFPGISSGTKCMGKRTPLVSRKTERQILMGAFGACLAGMLGGKSLHVATGAAFTLLAVRHMYTRRNLLL